MKEYLEKIPKELQELINKARDLAAKESFKVYLVGGFVRDLILGVKNLDLDIVIENNGIKFAEAFANSLGAKITVHKQFGTATVFVNPDLKIDGSTTLTINPERVKRVERIDFSSARCEFYPKPAHLPVVSPGSLRDDLFRRDFTINAMAIDLNDGRLLDYFGGQVDLKNKIIRILHPLSFIDDPTRILRAIRFEQRYSFKMEPKTLSLLKEAVKMNLLGRVHPHRLRDDLILILKERKPIKELKRLEELTGFSFILPTMAVSRKTYLFLMVLEKEIKWFNISDSRRRPLDIWLIYLMGLLDSLDEKTVKKICGKFGLRRGEEKRLLSYKQFKLKEIKDLSKTKMKPSKIYALLEPLSYEAIIALRAKYKNQIFRRNLADFLEIYNGIRILVCGDDLRCLGLLPGPRYQKIFSLVLNAKLNGEVKTKDEELSLIRGLLRK
ncbi:MAG: CCA tRNA nucleotidyltransferase [Candidatus Omnitrophota bacterium]|nr:CCA tRNA nucleotidyltransferase [Candidatus Omnitrophota bacterium]